MPNRTALDERDKFDHGSHPTTHRTKDDLHAPAGGTKEKPDSENDPPVDDSADDKSGR